MKLVRIDGILIIDRDANTGAELVEYCVANNVALYRANLYRANLEGANLEGANLEGANLERTNLEGANLEGANLEGANLEGANFYRANLERANLEGANLYRANLIEANLERTNLEGANLYRANLERANLEGANFYRANLTNTKGLVKLMGVSQGNFYWKRFNSGLNNNGFQFKVGLNTLRPKEVFADDDRVLCSYPGFHFASKSWCDLNYGDRPLEAKIRIPEDAKINEPWATDGKASADMIEIIQIFDVATGEDVTDQYR